MKKHDETIQNLFDDYAEELKPRRDLADKAMNEMVAHQAKPSPSVRKKPSRIHLGWIVTAAVVFIAVIAIIFDLSIFNDDGELDGSGSSQFPAQTVAYYNITDVKGRSVSRDDCDDMLQVSKLVANGYQVLGERYYAFFTEDGHLRYIKAYLGVRAPDGTFTELTLIAEVDGYVRRDLQTIYQQYAYSDGLEATSSFDNSGEYVTNAYFAARNLHFYVVARNGERTDVAKEILQTLS